MSEHSIITQSLTQKYFRFLEDKYGFKFDVDKNMYFSEKFCIYITASRLEPIIDIWIKSEPEYTKMNFKWFVKFLEHRDLSTHHLKNSLDKNFSLFSRLLKNHIRQIIDEEESLILKVIILFFENSQRNLKMSKSQLANATEGYKLLYEYIRLKEADWDSQPDLQK